MCLAVTKGIISVVICSLRNEKILLVYYLSHVLVGAETQHNPLETHIFSFIISAKKLKPYFQVHLVTVLKNVPIRRVIQKLDFTS